VVGEPGAIEDDATLPEAAPTARRPEECLVEGWLGLLGHRWTALVLWHLHAAPRRYTELQALLPGISPKVLADRLAALERNGLVARAPLPGRQGRARRYALTEAAGELVRLLGGISAWAEAMPPPR
jgi:DNA-binding HxlR family transcriptional regulator